VAAAERGEKSVIYTFDEDLSSLYIRTESLGIPLRTYLDQGLIQVHQMNPAEVTPGAFAERVRVAVTEEKAQLVVLDSLNGYLFAMPEERFLTAHLHELFIYLSQQGVNMICVMAQHGMLGPQLDASSPLDVSYLADTVILLRYFEAMGEVHKAISIMKNRGGPHERTIRELVIRPDGIHVGEPLLNFHGVLTGVPEYQQAAEGAFKQDRVQAASESSLSMREKDQP
jgi:circadian clock protein KaiC